MKRLTKKDLLKEIAKQINLRKKIAKDIVDILILDIRDSIAEGGYKTIKCGELKTTRTTRKTKQKGIPIIEANKDYMIGTILFGTNVGKKEARKAIRIMADKVAEAAKENDIVEIEEVGRFKNEAPGKDIREFIFEPFEPKEIEFPELESLEKK